MKAIINRGISGSGKSTSTLNYLDEYKIICRDEFRKELVPNDPDINFWEQYSFDKNIENTVTSLVDKAIIECSKTGSNIILDNTNLFNRKVDSLKTYLKSLGFEVEENNCNIFSDINIYHKRNKNRLHSVNSGVVNDQFITSSINELVPLESNKIFIVDLDGTISLMNGRKAFEYKHSINDVPNEYVTNIIKHLVDTGYVDYVQFLTGRESYHYDIYIEWLELQGFDMNIHKLLCRKTSDYRKDSIIKKEIYDNCLKQNTILGVFDDRPQVVQMWWDENLPVFHVGDFRKDF